MVTIIDVTTVILVGTLLIAALALCVALPILFKEIRKTRRVAGRDGRR